MAIGKDIITIQCILPGQIIDGGINGFMSKKFKKCFVLLVFATIFVAVAVALVLKNKKEEPEEYGTMQVFTPDPVLSEDEAKSLEEQQDNSNLDNEERGDIFSDETGDFNAFMSLFLTAMEKEGTSYASDTDFVKDCIQSSKVDAPVPGENLKEYFDSLQSVEWNETLVGDLVFFLDENQESIHMGIKGSRNHMFHRKDGVITEEYISDYSEKFVFARLFSTNQVDDETLLAESESSGYMNAEVLCKEGVDLTPLEKVKQQLDYKLNNVCGDIESNVRAKQIEIMEVTDDAYEGDGVIAYAMPDNVAKIITIHYDPTSDRLYVVP